ncbi:MAG: hypothetical protein KOO62_04370 [candidate division Zixibacteria bacterium]|nr:hypothetical protein [candidate division Zixibacteria bacterium]
MAGETLISYQGRLTWPTGTPVTDGSHSVGFSLHTDFTGGDLVWQETATVATTSGLFVHLLGSITPLLASVITDHDPLYLELSIESQTITPRTRLTSVPRSIVAEGLRASDDSGLVVLQAVVDSGGALYLFDFEGNPGIILHGGLQGDSAVILPPSSVNSSEILDEPGIAGYSNSSQVDLSTGEMADLVDIEITTPADGYIILYGKCYLMLSGTTGTNSARIQIDESQGGVSQYPFYTQAGLSGYVNTGTNYFPIYVTRTYYREAGTYEFRLEGRAMNSPPAVAQSWDHQLTAVFFPSSYGWVSGYATTANGFPSARPVHSDSSDSVLRSDEYYEVDLRDLEIDDQH